MTELRDILTFHPGAPWTFLDVGFWLFLMGVLAIDGLMHKDKRRTLRHVWLLMASLLFYWKTSGWFVLILLFSTLSDYLIGHRIERSDRQGSRNRWLALSILLNLGLLFYFKYTYFL